MEVSEIAPPLQPALQAATRCGAVFRPNLVQIPLLAFHQPGVFAVVRSLFEKFGCPTCGEPEVIRHGQPKRKRPVQQYRCTNSECRSHRTRVIGKHRTKDRRYSRGPRVFHEYQGTPLEDATLGAREWFAIWFWYWRDKDDRLSLAEIARRLGVNRLTVQRCAKPPLDLTRKHGKKRRLGLSYPRTRSRGTHYVARAPIILFSRNRRRWSSISIDMPYPECGPDDLVLHITPPSGHSLYFMRMPARSTAPIQESIPANDEAGYSDERRLELVENDWMSEVDDDEYGEDERSNGGTEPLIEEMP